MKNQTINSEQGDRILARMGKKVLRAGGKELTLQVVDSFDINNKDVVVEFALGMGYTAQFLLQNTQNLTPIRTQQRSRTTLNKTNQRPGSKYHKHQCCRFRSLSSFGRQSDWGSHAYDAGRL